MGHGDIPFLKEPEVKLPDAEGMVGFTEPGGNTNLDEEVERYGVSIPEASEPTLSLDDLTNRE